MNHQTILKKIGKENVRRMIADGTAINVPMTKMKSFVIDQDQAFDRFAKQAGLIVAALVCLATISGVAHSVWKDNRPIEVATRTQ